MGGTPAAMIVNNSIHHHMKTSLNVISLILSVGFPSVFLAEFLGANLPSMLDPSHTFNAFVVALTLLTLVSDYSRSAKPVALSSSGSDSHVTQQIRQTESLRMAA